MRIRWNDIQRERCFVKYRRTSILCLLPSIIIILVYYYYFLKIISLVYFRLHWPWSLLELFSGCSARAQELCSQPLEHKLSNYDSWILLLWGMWDLPGSWIKPGSPALAGRFFTTEPPGYLFFIIIYWCVPILFYAKTSQMNHVLKALTTLLINNSLLLSLCILYLYYI